MSNGFTFRSKDNSWTKYEIKFEKDNKVITIPHTEDEFMKAFLSNYILRPSCYSCQFKGNNYFSGSIENVKATLTE